jgi:hypothetical protein
MDQNLQFKKCCTGVFSLPETLKENCSSYIAAEYVRICGPWFLKCHTLDLHLPLAENTIAKETEFSIGQSG